MDLRASAADPLSSMSLSNSAQWLAVRQLTKCAPAAVVLGGGGYNPWTLIRYWAGLWAVLAGKAIPANFTNDASAVFEGLTCDWASYSAHRLGRYKASGENAMTGNWLQALAQIEDLEDAQFDPTLIAQLEQSAIPTARRGIRFSTPTFKSYDSCEVSGCSKNSFPAFSVTAGACALDCDHCQAKILEPMIPATTPQMLEDKVRALVKTDELGGFLLSGGSNKRNEIKYERYYPVIEKLKHDYPDLQIAIHSALLDEPRAKMMESAGVDTAMMDVIGAQETIEQVYHLDRSVDDFEATLALKIVARHNIHSLVLVVVMPFYARPGTFKTVSADDCGRVFLQARELLADKPVLLGCARPPGMHRRITDAYAVMAGLDGIAFPADGALAVAELVGRSAHQEHACCSVKTGQTIKLDNNKQLSRIPISVATA